VGVCTHRPHPSHFSSRTAPVCSLPRLPVVGVGLPHPCSPVFLVPRRALSPTSLLTLALTGGPAQADEQAGVTPPWAAELQKTLASLVVQTHRSEHNISSIGSAGWDKMRGILSWTTIPGQSSERATHARELGQRRLLDKKASPLPFIWDPSKEDSTVNRNGCAAWLQQHLALGEKLEILCTAKSNKSLLNFEVSGMFTGIEQAVSHTLL
jgi:hypothetical protein